MEDVVKNLNMGFNEIYTRLKLEGQHMTDTLESLFDDLDALKQFKNILSFPFVNIYRLSCYVLVYTMLSILGSLWERVLSATHKIKLSTVRFFLLIKLLVLIANLIIDCGVYQFMEYYNIHNGTTHQIVLIFDIIRW
jgi:hypothetical protein